MVECNEHLRAAGRPYPRTCALCGLGRCKMLAEPAVPADQQPFTAEEKDRLASMVGATAFMWDAMGDKTAGELRAEMRRKFLKPPSIADNLLEILNAYQDRVGSSKAKVVASAVDELNRLTKMFNLRPLSELRQEPYKSRPTGNGPFRWVILWGPSGHAGFPWRCAVGRHNNPPDDDKFAGCYVRLDGDLFTDDGPEATHFSELPDNAVDGSA